MKKLTFIICALFIISCKKENQVVNAEPIEKTTELTLERFDLQYASCTPSTLPLLMQKFPRLFPKELPIATWENKIKDPLFIEYSQEVKNKFKNIDTIKNQLDLLVSGVQKYFPEEKTPRLITLVNELVIDKRAFYTTEEILISLDNYLGKSHKFYSEIPVYLRENLEPTQILPDLVTNFGYRKVLPPTDKTLLGEMIYYGKIMYLKDMLLTETADFTKIGFTKQKFNWCIENEEQVWSFFVGEKLLYDVDEKNIQKFINDAPFSKFDREIDQDTPGRIGQWIGWQIVRAYMANNNTTVAELMKKDALEVLNNSKYKPAKRD